MKNHNFKLFVFSILLTVLFFGCNDGSTRKIKLSNQRNGSSEVQSVSTTIRVSPDEQSSISIFYFENKTNKPGLNWLRRGITDMLEAELSQSPYYKVIPIQRILEIAKQNKIEESSLHDLTVAYEIARKANAENVLTGTYFYARDSLIIELQVLDVSSRKTLRKTVVSGKGLEQIFVMVNNLSDKIRTELRTKLAVHRQAKSPQLSQSDDIRLTDMTSSIQAYRAYSLARDNIDKFLWGEANHYLEEALLYDSTFAEAYIHLVQVKKQIGERKDAIIALQKAEKYANKLSKTGQIYLKLLKAENSQNLVGLISTMEEMLNYAPYDIEIRNQLATFLMNMKRFDEALDQYEFVLELDPSRKLVYNQIGYLYAYRGDFTNAYKYLEKYKELAPDEANPYDSMGEILLMAGRFKEAAAEYEQALQIRPDFLSSALKLSRIYSELGDFTNAMKYSDHYLKYTANDNQAFEGMLSRALILWRFDKLREAERTLKKIVTTNPYSTSAVYILAELYKAQNRDDEADKLYLDYFEKSRKIVESQKSTVSYNMQFFQICLDENLPPQKLIPLLELLYDREKTPFNKNRYAQLLGIFYLRKGDVASAEKYHQRLDADFVDALMQTPRLGWNSGGWKYLVEMVQRLPKQENPSYGYFEKMIKKARKSNRQDIAIYTRFINALAREKEGDSDFLMKEYKRLGVPLENDWRVIGPFIDHCGFTCKFPPEEPDVPIRDNSTFPSQWLSGEDGAHDGYTDLKAIFDKVHWAVAYATVYVKSSEKRVIQIRISSDESCKLWFNNDLVWQTFRLKEDAYLDNDIVSVVLKRGLNKIMIKTTNSLYSWGFNLRITDESGRGIPDLEFLSQDKVEKNIAAVSAL